MSVTLHGQPVNVGDKVWSVIWGEGCVSRADVDDICVKFEWDKFSYHENGQGRDSNFVTLYWQPISPEAIEAAKVKPKEPEYEYQWVFFNVMKHRFETTDYFSSGITPNVVKPESLIRIEESKREVKP
jgi:hypothetical protein